MDQIIYYLYHIPGKKIGVTRNLKSRLTVQQGYQPSEYEVLESSNDIDYISDREAELQLIYGYKVDRDCYKELMSKLKLNKNMKLNVTDQTVTFPCPVNKLKGNLMDNKHLRIETSFGTYALSESLIKWIVENANTSMFNPSRSYVYNKALDEFAKSLGKQTPATEYKNQPESVVKEDPSVYDLVRRWADERGIYRTGNVKTQYIKLQEESGELAKAILKEDKAEFIDAIGDMVVVLTNLAALEGLKIEDCIISAYDVIKSRQGSIVNGTFVKETQPVGRELNYHIKQTL
jgi:NTP pyrophosphatase (non-canonical NTP hydrolase)